MFTWTGMGRSLSAGAVGVVVMSLVMVVSAGTAMARPVGGCTTIQSNTGLLCVDVESTSVRDIKSFGGDFTSGNGVVRPRLVADLLDEQGRVIDHIEQSWSNGRNRESIMKTLTTPLATPAARVCASVIEAGERLDTACVPV